MVVLLTDAPLLQQITELRVVPNELKAAIALSDDAAELADYEKLLILQATCDGVKRLNYEAESSHLSKLVTELESPVYSGAIARLGLSNYAGNIKSTSRAYSGDMPKRKLRMLELNKSTLV